MLIANFTLTSTTGFVRATEFTVTNLTTGSNIQQYVWDFGNGDLIYNTVNPTYTYNYPGTYTVSLSVTDFNNILSVATQQVEVDHIYRDYIKFTQIPETFPNPGKATNVPFKIEVLTTSINENLTIDLFAANSNSTPYEFLPKKWAFLTPTWRFLDSDSNIVTNLNVSTTPIYYNNKIVAVSGTAEFYFIDSSSTGNPTENCPILITTTLQTSSFNFPQDSNIYSYSSHTNNQTVRAGVIWQVNDLFPNLLKVTSNYIDPINPLQWEGIKIPVLITCHSDRSLVVSGADSVISEPIFSYPSSNEIGKLTPLTLTLSGINAADYSVDEAPLYFQAKDNINSRTGGYIFTTLSCNTTAKNTIITANGRVNSSEEFPTNTFFYPYGYAPNTSVWISNPQKNTLNKVVLVPDPGTCKTVNYYRDNGILTDGTIKEVTVPANHNTSTFNYNLSGFSGIYGIGIDPRDYSVVAADAELDRLYRFSNTGDVLKVFELSSLDPHNPHKKMYEFWTWQTPTPETSSITKFAFYKPVPLSPNPANYILTLGGAVIPTDYLEIDKYEKTIRIKVPISKLSLPLNSDYFLKDNLAVNVIQLFNPALPETYISTLKYWTTLNTNTNTNSVFLTGAGNIDLVENSNNFIVSIDGIVQRPDTYTVSDFAKIVTFTENLLPNTRVHILYIPTLNTPANWIQTFTNTQTNVFHLTGNPLYKNDPQSEFLVNIGGVLQHPSNYYLDYLNQQLVFNTNLPVSIPISVTQLSIPEEVNNPAALTPAQISLDKDYNIWVTLFNSVSVLKFDPDFNLLFSVAPTNIDWQSRPTINNPKNLIFETSFWDDSYLNNELYAEEFLLKPPTVETDKNNNCWVTYAHPLCSLLVKYSPTGQSLLQIPTGNFSIPTSLVVDNSNNVWVSNFHGSTYIDTALSGSLQKYDTNTGAVLTSINGINRPTYICLDRNNNLWFTTGLRNIGYLNTSTLNLNAWTVPDLTNEASSTTFNTTSLALANNEEDEELGGLAVDVYDRVWLLDSTNNRAWVLSATPQFNLAPIRTFKVRPHVTQGYYIDLDSGLTFLESGNFKYRSTQATGDWTGNRWYQKYATPNALSSVAVSGVSNTFDVLEFKNLYQTRRLNESFNNSQYYKDLALPRNLQANTRLFDEFFSAAVGTGYLSANEDLGQIVYEKIANFVNNHSDIDSCNIDQLISHANEVGAAVSDYVASYPTDIRNMVNIASIPRSKLWGIRDNAPVLSESLGSLLNTETAFVTAGTQIIFRNKFNGSLKLVVAPLLDNLSVYPLKDFNGFGFSKPISDNYLVYSYSPTYENSYIENIIDWDSEFTTLSPNLSTANDWYGDNGAIENSFRYLLTKNLFPK
jgi:hypothetical protein